MSVMLGPSDRYALSGQTLQSENHLAFLQVNPRGMQSSEITFHLGKFNGSPRPASPQASIHQNARRFSILHERSVRTRPEGKSYRTASLSTQILVISSTHHPPASTALCMAC